MTKKGGENTEKTLSLFLGFVEEILRKGEPVKHGKRNL
jgi:hypothetical protein